MAFFFFLSLLLTCNFHQTLARKAKETPATSDVYIVHVDVPKNQVATTMESLDLEMWYQSFLVSPIILSDSDDGSSSRIIYSYRNIFKGFAAKLSSEEVKEMSKKEGFISARPQKILPLHTTHTPNFLGLSQNLGLWKDSNYGKGVIIGVLDTGILPDHPSFDDEGMPPPPAKWTGKCDSRCNNKLIGTRHFGEQANSSADDEGHGTHTASTAAGSFVKGANVFGNANGTASGIAPMAHLAMYKVCTKSGCTDTDLLAGIDAAIQDGVDIISLSLGGISETFFEDSLALGAFTAIQKGIFVSASAGNMGPDFRTLSNEAPWILTVGASSVDRIIKVTALLGNNVSIDGESFSQPKDFPATMFPLVYPGSDKSNPDAEFCGLGSLRKINVTGKIVVCNLGGNVTRIIKERIVKSAGAAGIIVINEESDGYTTFAELHDLPAAHISYADGMKILAYIGSTPRPTTTLMFKGTVIGNTEAPSVSSFSSRGPSRASPGILKPDIIGPGTNILAAWPFSIENKTHTNITFNMISGTSMACPHLSGVAALIKSVHPDWSPAAIKSAIMTSADSLNLHHQPILDETLHTANVFATGSGHVNPSRASDPGLVYDLKPEDYIPYLCGLNYTSRQVRIITQRTVNCSEISNMDEAELNYPSFSIALGSTKKTYIRSVTNVGEGNSSYVVEINPPLGVTVSVEPTNLDFTETNETMSYQVTFVAQPATRTRTKFAQGFLKWNSAKHSVRSPIAVIFH